jgi:oligoendopeptidase F
MEIKQQAQKALGISQVRRHFLPENLSINSWGSLEPFFQNLSERQINSWPSLEQWLFDKSELEAFLEEDMAWRYIKMSCDTSNIDYKKSFSFYISEIEPKVSVYLYNFDKKLLSPEILQYLDKEKYHIYLRRIQKKTEIFREENLPIITQLQTEQQKYRTCTAAMTINLDGNEYTMQKAYDFFRHTDRKMREKVYGLIKGRRSQEAELLNSLFSELVSQRNKLAINAGFSNFRDYTFAALGRFDYDYEDCYRHHQAVASEIVPLTRSFDEIRRNNMKLDMLKPWDTDVDTSGRAPVIPFTSTEDLIDKTIECFHRLNPYYGECLRIMKKMGRLDLDSRKGKAPGGFNYPLYETGVPFIFMNSVGSVRDLVTMMHEGGHAIHSFLIKDYKIFDFKLVSAEIAELASMSMELISMEHWDVFFDNKEDLQRAKRFLLEKVVRILPWVAQVDKFQHWVYLNPHHSVEERTKKWIELNAEFGSLAIDWSGNEIMPQISWHKQLHIFELPFYYIEYNVAQLGAMAIWRNYKKDPHKALQDYEYALRLGNTRSIKELYKAAGIEFNFSKDYVNELIEFVKEEYYKV